MFTCCHVGLMQSINSAAFPGAPLVTYSLKFTSSADTATGQHLKGQRELQKKGLCIKTFVCSVASSLLRFAVMLASLPALVWRASANGSQPGPSCKRTHLDPLISIKHTYSCLISQDT